MLIIVHILRQWLKAHTHTEALAFTIPEILTLGHAMSGSETSLAFLNLFLCILFSVCVSRWLRHISLYDRLIIY